MRDSAAMLLKAQPLLTLITAVALSTSVKAANCPWDQTDLKPWSEGSSWTSGKAPVELASVVIPSGTRILLDKQPPKLSTITIEPNAMLVWGDVDGIRLETSNILVKGEFHIGSEDCRFTKKANILLYGLSNSQYNDPEFGRKFIAVTEGATLEIHGAPKLTWTKLTATVGPAKGTCGTVYDSRDQPFSTERQRGLHVTVWDISGQWFDTATFATEHYKFAAKEQEDFFEYVKALPDGKVVAVAVYGDIGVVSNQTLPWEKVYSTIEGLGGKVIRDVKSLEPYALVAVKGQPGLSQEKRIARRGLSVEKMRAEAVVEMVNSELAFVATSILTPESFNDEVMFRIIRSYKAFPILDLMDDASTWQPGDRIVVASTDYDWTQAEVRTILPCPTCTVKQVKVDGEFRYTHYGEITYRVDERAEVGVLTRNIRIEGSIEDNCYVNSNRDAEMCQVYNRDTFGGHIMIVRGFTAVHLEGAEFYRLGQQSTKARYPIHFHMCDDIIGRAWVRGNTIHESNSRCVTIHGTDNLEVSDNFCYRHLGHGFFLEDSSEQGTILHHNLGIGTMHGTLMLHDMHKKWCPTDMPFFVCGALSTFWITHPNNTVTNNVAAGSDVHGMMITFSDVPLGFSFLRQQERGLVKNESTRYIKVKEFSGNVMHSNMEVGLMFDMRISHGVEDMGVFIPENGMLSLSAYTAREPPQPDGTPVDTVLTRLTFYKNNMFDTWVRCGNIVITRSTFADSPEGYLAAQVGGPSSCDIRDSIFIGETDNKGEPLLWYNSSGIYANTPGQRPMHKFDRSFAKDIPDATLSGVSFYQGPVFIDNCYFDRYSNWFFNDSFQQTWGFRPVRPAAAISYHHSNDYPSASWSGMSNLKFGYCEDENNGKYVFHGNESTRYWDMELDGPVGANFRDYDGSLTGTPRSQIVRTSPYFLGPECLIKPEWGMSVCPYKYAMLSVVGNDGVLAEKSRKSWPVFFHRDDEPKQIINLRGKNLNHYTVRTQMSYTVRFNTSLGDNPTYVRLLSWDLERGDVIRVAICFPKDTTTFEILSDYPKINMKAYMPNFVSSLQALDDDTTGNAFFWDPKSGYFYLKLMSNETRGSPDEECTGDKCPKVYITRKDGSKGPVTCEPNNPPYVSKQPPPPAIKPKVCTGPDSPEGLGALDSAEIEAPIRKMETCRFTQRMITRTRPREVRGCFAESARTLDFTLAFVKLYQSMTQEYCQSRCFQRGHIYAALTSGIRCYCSDSFGRATPMAMSECNAPCTGNPSQTCGGNLRYQVFTSGAALAPPPVRCGPGNRGVVYKGVCVYLSYLREDFHTAMKTCIQLTGTLSKIDTVEKQKFVEWYLMGVETNVWTGLARQTTGWAYLDGTPLGNYTNWGATDRLERPSQFMKLQANRALQWFAYNYNEYNMALCDLPLNYIIPTVSVCLPGWILNGQSCYQKRDVEVSSYELYASLCNTDKSTLLSIDSKSENDFISQLLPGKQVWLGYKYDSTADNFVMPNGVPYSYSNWFVSNPLQLLSNGYCSVLTPEGTWRPRPCSGANAQVMCEMALSI